MLCVSCVCVCRMHSLTHFSLSLGSVLSPSFSFAAQSEARRVKAKNKTERKERRKLGEFGLV